MNRKNVVDGCFGQHQQHNSQNRVFLNITIVGDPMSDFVFDCLFKFNSCETTGHINSKLSIIYHHTKVRVLRRLASHDDISIEDIFKNRIFDEEKRFSA